MTRQASAPHAVTPLAKFKDPNWTAKGETRASVPFDRLETLWINTGTLCNITCRNCYIESSPTNDRLAYITTSEVVAFLNEAKQLGTRKIAFTGGEPFLNPDFLDMTAEALWRGFDVLILTNAMLPMQRPRLKDGLVDFNARFPDRLTVRVSLDHFTRELHEAERGEGTWSRAVEGLDWLTRCGFKTAIAGRMAFAESEAASRAGFARLIAERGWRVDAANHSELMLFPEMDGKDDVPEITTACWAILEKESEPDDVRDHAHGRQAQGCRPPRRTSLHAASL